MLSGLELALILILAATLIAVALRRYGVPPLVAYLAVGVLLGPYASSLAADGGVLQAAASCSRCGISCSGWARPSCSPRCCL